MFDPVMFSAAFTAAAMFFAMVALIAAWRVGRFRHENTELERQVKRLKTQLIFRQLALEQAEAERNAIIEALGLGKGESDAEENEEQAA